MKKLRGTISISKSKNEANKILTDEGVVWMHIWEDYNFIFKPKFGYSSIRYYSDISWVNFIYVISNEFTSEDNKIIKHIGD